MVSGKLLKGNALFDEGPGTPQSLAFLEGGGATGELIRAHDWTNTPLGEPARWPPSLKTLVGVMLGAAQPMFVAWGWRDRTMLYNDSYAEVLGSKHPAGLGQSFNFIWAEAMSELEPLFAAVYAGEAIHREDIQLFIERGDGLREAHFASSYNPIRDDSGTIVGLYCACRETTVQFNQARRRAAEIERQHRQFDAAPGFIAMFSGPDHVYEFANQTHQRIFGNRDVIGKSVREVYPETADQQFHDLLDRVYRTGERFVGQGLPIRLTDSVPPQTRYIDFIYAPIVEAEGTISGIFCEGFEVTDQYLANEARVQSEARFRAAVDAVEGVLWTNSALGEMIGEQPGWAALTGQTRAEYEGYGWADAVHPDDAQPTIDAWKMAVEEHRPFAFEHRVRASGCSGEWRLFSIRAIPVADGNGQIAEWVGVHTDITDERAMQAALRESHADYRYAAELNPQVAWTATPDGQLDRVAERWHEWTGSSGLGSSWGEGLHADDLGHSTDAWIHSITTGEPYDVEHRVKRVDGSYRWARSRAWARRDTDGAIVKWYGATEDIHDRKQAEIRAHVVSTELRGVVEAMPGFVWTADAQGGLTYTSPTWHDYSGSSPQDSAGSGWGGFVHPDDQTSAFDQWARSIKTGEPYEVEFRLRQADGSYHWWLARARKQTDDHGGWIGTATELDAIVAARDTLVRSRQELEHEVDARTAELRVAEDALRQSQKLEAIGQLTGGVAHDFNNLLTVIRGSVDLLRRPGLTDDRRDRYIGAISDTVTRAAKLTGQLLAFARRQALMPEVFDVGDAITATRDMLGTLTGSRIRIEITLPDPPCFTRADPSQFDTAIVNMVVNARDAMAGEGTLTIAVTGSNEVPAVRTHAAIVGDFVAVTISDTGTGIASNRIDQIFEPFYTTKGVGQGTGLGLSQVYGFAKQSGGEVRVESRVGEGSIFTLYLPCAEASAVVEPRPMALAPLAAGHGTSVLVVEDNADVGEFARQALTELGYRTTFAPDAESALATLAEGAQGFDVVFSDVVMPGMNGVELACAIRERHPELPVILTSGYSEVLAQEGSAGFDLLRKPYSMEELSRVLQVATASRAGAVAVGDGDETTSTNGAISAP